MRRSCALSLLALAACSSGDGTPIVTPPPPPVAASIEVISSLPAGASLRGGSQVQLSATVKTAAGEPIASAPVSWSSNLPSLASVSGSGLVTLVDTAMGSKVITVTASSGSVSRPVFLPVSDWALERTVDPVSLTVTTIASRLSSAGFGTLFIRCRGGLLELFVSGTVITQNGSVTYRFLGKNPVSATWGESTDFKSLFAPSASAAKAFADQFATSDTLFFQYRQFQAGLINLAFPLTHSGSVYPRVGGTCGL